MTEHRAQIDEALSTYAEGWTLARMPAVDRNVLRIGAFEVLWVDDVPDPVAVTEAVALVRDLSTDESPGSSTASSAHAAQQGVVDPLTRSGQALLFSHDEHGAGGVARQAQ